VFVRHPSDGTPVTAVFGWAAFIGAVTGFSETITLGGTSRAAYSMLSREYFES
jgi:hypothetical protein